MDPGRQIEHEAKRLFDRVLSQWAMDVLRLRGNGLDQPCTRTADESAYPFPPGGAQTANDRRRWMLAARPTYIPQKNIPQRRAA